MKPRMRRGFSLVEMIVVIVILGVLAAIFLPRYLGTGTQAALKSGQKAATPMNAARGTECVNNLSQIRAAYQMAATMGDESRPRTLLDLKTQGVMESMMYCPVSRQPYRFDPRSGRVACPTPGHERF